MKAEPLDIIRENSGNDQDGSGNATSGFQRSFCLDDCKTALAKTGQYQCGENFFMAGLFTGPTRQVPVRQTAVDQLRKFMFKKGADVGFYPGTIWIALDSADVNPRNHVGQLTELSPEELRYAVVLQCAEEVSRGIDDARANQWRTLFLTCTTLFVVCPRDARFWKAVSLRNVVTADFEAISRTPFQTICEIVHFKVGSD